MSKKICPYCKSEVRWGDAIMKCGNCSTVFCPKCGKGFQPNKCPVCNTIGNIIARG